MRGGYIAKRRLEELNSEILSERDKTILASLERCRYLLTGQISRLHFIGNANPTAALRATSRVMHKLRGYGLVESLQRRIGGVRAGSNSFAWVLTESGVRLLHLNDPDFALRKRPFEPSLNFLKHTLEVSEAFVQIIEICRRHNLELANVEMEPKCWRGYTGEDGKPATMKPDMLAITGNGKYEDSWFIEVDMDTESPSIVLDKCRRYTHYYKSGLEQKRHGVFPMVAWLVYSQNRKAKLQQYLADCRDIPEPNKSIFTVIMPDEFETLIVGGVEALAERGA